MERDYLDLGRDRPSGVEPGTRKEPADQGGVSQRRAVAQFGVVERGEVVDGDHGAGGPGGWDDEVGAVHDVGRADEPLDGRMIETRTAGHDGLAGIGRWVTSTPDRRPRRQQARDGAN